MSSYSPPPAKVKLHTLLNEGRTAEALELAVFLRSKYPDDREIHHLHGVALLNGGQYPAAEEMLRSALRRYPEDWQFHEFLGFALAFQHKSEEAEKEYRAAIAHGAAASRKEIAEIRCALADSLWGQNKRQDALDEWRIALRIDPKNKEAKQCIKECTNAYGEPKAPNEMFDDLYHYQGIHIRRYFSLAKRKEFVSSGEMDDVLRIVQEGWNTHIPPRMPAFDRLTPAEKSAFFKSITLSFTSTVLKWRGKK